MWTKENIPDLTGKTALVTGGNTGIGYETVKALYEKGAKVTLAARDEIKASDAIRNIQETTKGTGILETGILNLSNLAEIKTFTDKFRANHNHLDILINNAGVMIPPASKTDDGFELQFGVNFLGHFALTGHLFSLLQNSSHARVVTLSSGAATFASNIDFENLRLEKPYNEWQSYAVSKLADILFAYELDRKLKATDMNILSVAAHPGVTKTDLQRHIPMERLEGMFSEFEEVMDPWQGALPSLFAATDVSVKGGEFFGPDGKKEYAGYPALSKHSTPAMNDKELSEKLWKYAEEVTHLDFHFQI
ncbi:oxidoreductase [Elizabethkingia anophelis]|uniref:oxidoreductase n=1 Tax=Elizabethkingia anophelis TaxID=1117645 RepID=UPI0021A710DF|nr:oxidoreductase [Elizabethkingia anophelis]MCT3648393.1 SDR family NAD(P)-dependent oxidoreductase [Elizabethkingia anophelis]MCT3695418.1 SDR family NAD(P)-dependent oxidoreductase [Elizabethkingia anophelis]MCT3859382.1 SDR family NAD(P)-dependent oxidoreductase [Elizabethkingia anophelis]MCT3912687.1 SDR family NAD(P)-dependent oxidoreductase [Elizabethkingia anophelis]MCT4311713.1 SDR family NAD(P)-dependent oxidoreductase [Elizabethkingia anophelis]